MPYRQLQKDVELLTNRFLDQHNSHESLSRALVSVLNAEIFLIQTLLSDIDRSQQTTLTQAFLRETVDWHPNGHSRDTLSIGEFETVIRAKTLAFAQEKPLTHEVRKAAAGFHNLADVILQKCASITR